MRLAQGLRDDVVGSQRNTLLADLGQSKIPKMTMTTMIIMVMMMMMMVMVMVMVMVMMVMNVDDDDNSKTTLFASFAFLGHSGPFCRT